MKYTETHEWIDIQNGLGVVGITDHAQKELGDIVYVELPKEGKQIKAGEEIVVLESTKAAADVYCPISGTIIEVNTALSTASELVNQSPESKGWLFKIKPSDLEEIDKLLDDKAYQAMLSKA
jgi:glycine cleavage system H protein